MGLKVLNTHIFLNPAALEKQRSLLLQRTASCNFLVYSKFLIGFWFCAIFSATVGLKGSVSVQTEGGNARPDPPAPKKKPTDQEISG